MPSIRRYDVQARFAFFMAVASILPWLAAVGAMIRNYKPGTQTIEYGDASMFKAAFLVCIATAGGLSLIATGLGFNSAGQRRNKEERKSWAGFFIGTAMLSLTIIVFFAFRKLGFELIQG